MIVSVDVHASLFNAEEVQVGDALNFLGLGLLHHVAHRWADRPFVGSTGHRMLLRISHLLHQQLLLFILIQFSCISIHNITVQLLLCNRIREV